MLALKRRVCFLVVLSWAREFVFSGGPVISPASQWFAPPVSESGLRKNANRSSLAIGLQEAAPPFQQTSRPVSINNPDMTFDSILGNPTQTAAALGLKQEKKDKKKK